MSADLEKRVHELSVRALDAGDEDLDEIVSELRRALREQHDRSRKLITDQARQWIENPPPNYLEL